MSRQQVPNYELQTDTARLNLLTNGGMDVWQRGNGPFTSNYAADRWVIGLSGTDTISVSRDSANADVANGSFYCAACTFTLGTGGGNSVFYQVLKTTADLNQFRGRTISFSVRVRTSTANAVRAFISSDGTGNVTQTSSFHTGSGAYQTLTVTNTIPADANAGANAGVFLAASCTAYLDNAMLVVGSVPADYAPLHPADDLARCLRYYEVDSGTSVPIGTAQAYGTGAFQVMVRFRAIKAVVPTVTVSAVSDFGVMNATGGANLTVTGFTPGAIQATGFGANGTVASGLTAGNATNMVGVTGNAKVMVEANP